MKKPKHSSNKTPYNPLVSILIPTFNSAQYLSAALDSALAQTYQNIEIVVHNDASTDNTQSLLANYKDKRLRIIHTRKNHGMIGGWNYIVKYAKGEYIKFLASDDLLAPNCVKVLVHAAQLNPHSMIITCRRNFINESGKTLKTLGFSNHSTIASGTAHARKILTTLRENKIGEPSAVLYPRKLIKTVGEFDPAFSQFADFEYWIRLLAYGDIVYVHQTLCSFRVHATSNTSKAILDGRFITETFHLINKYYKEPFFVKKFSLTRRDKYHVLITKILDTLKNIKDLLLSGNYAQAMRYMARLLH